MPSALRSYAMCAGQLVPALSELSMLKAMLRHGGENFTPFVFHSAGAQIIGGHAGLEGFLEAQRNKPIDGTDVDHIYRYFKALVQNVGKTIILSEENSKRDFLKKSLLRSLALADKVYSSEMSAESRQKRLVQVIGRVTNHLQNRVEVLDKANWIKKNSTTYHIFLQKFNLAGWRKLHGLTPHRISGKILADIQPSDLDFMQRKSISVLRFMDLFRRGVVGAKEGAGGSPFAIKEYTVDPAHGKQSDLVRLDRLMRRRGMRMMGELVLNHTSKDSYILEKDPTMYVHTLTEPTDTAGYFKHTSGKGVTYWIREGGFRQGNDRTLYSDTLQLDLTNPRTRAELIKQTLRMIEEYKISSFRVDMAHHLVDSALQHSWGEEHSNEVRTEFHRELISAIKSKYPDVAFVAEAFSEFEKLSQCGFDAVYGICDMTLPGKYLLRGWNSGFEKGDVASIRQAIFGSAQLNNEAGGATNIIFVGQHDSEAPWHTFKGRYRLYRTMTLLRPGPVSLLAGVDARYENPGDGVNEDKKIISFLRPESIEWRREDPIIAELLNTRARLKKILSDNQHFYPLIPKDESVPCVGYYLQKAGAHINELKVLVLGNASDKPITAAFDGKRYGMEDFTVTLAPYKTEVITIPAQEARQRRAA